MSNAVFPIGQELPVVSEASQPSGKTKTRIQKPLKKRVFDFMDSSPVQIFMGILLMLSLFLPDSWMLANASSKQDNVLYTILCIILALFVWETTVLSYCQENYLFGFFFWMDTLGTISIILDIGWIANTFMPDSGATSKGSLLRAARAAKLGARYGRLMRLMKMMRFFKFLPCFKVEEDAEPEPTMSAVRRVSSELSAVLSRRVAALVMIIVIVVPFLSYETIDNSTKAWCTNFRLMALSNDTSLDDMDIMIRKFKRFYHYEDLTPLKLVVESPNFKIRQHYDQGYYIRNDNIILQEQSYLVANQKYMVRLWMNNTVMDQWDSFFGIMLIILVIVVLIGFSASFQSAVDLLVVVPLEKMMNTLRKSATAMLKSMKAMSKEDEEKDKKIQNGEEDDDDLDGELETAVLEKMVEKLARIVKHVVSDTDLVVDSSVDSATASWLTQNYATNATKKKNIAKDLPEISEEEENLKLMATHKTVDSKIVNSWGYDVLLYDYQQLNEFNNYLFDAVHSFQEVGISTTAMNAFLKELSLRYIKENSYHNFHHACDVLQTTFRLVTVTKLDDIFTDLECFSMLVAAVGHDVGHPGVNNAFLIKTRHDLAMIHNDKSPLENMHCSVLYDMFRNDEWNIMATLSDAQWRESRKIILSLILGTDMAHHFDQVSKTQLFLEVNGEDVRSYCYGRKDEIECFSEDKNRIFIMELFLHCADISNPYKPFTICSRWADLVSQEFFTQGDKEKNGGLEISPMMDRNTSNLFNMQMGFIEFVVSPLINSVVNLFPLLRETGDNMLDNYIQWGEKRKEEIRTIDDGSSSEKREDDVKKLEERMNKFREKMAYLKGLEIKRKNSAGSLANTSSHQ